MRFLVGKTIWALALVVLGAGLAFGQGQAEPLPTKAQAEAVPQAPAPAAAAQKPAPPLVHPKKFYTAPTGVLYVNLAAPIYLKLTSDSTGKGEEVVLLNSTALTQGDQKPVPLFFENDGNHTLVHPNEAEWEKSRARVGSHLSSVAEPNSFFQIRADGQPPETKLKTEVKEKLVVGDLTIFGKPVLITLEPTDGLSGVESVFTSLEGQPFVVNQAPLEFGGQAPLVQLRYYALDRVGNPEPVKEFHFALDLTSPQTTLETVGPAVGLVLSPFTEFQLATTDNQAGVASIFAQIDEDPLGNKYLKPIKLDKLAEGLHQLRYASLDGVMNQEKVQTLDFFLDRSGPEPAYEIVGDQSFEGKTLFFSARTKIALTATDNKAGVKEIRYGFDKEPISLYQSPVSPLERPLGLQFLRIQAEDKVTNQAKEVRLDFVYDPIAPEPSHKFLGPQVTWRGRLYLCSRSQLVLSAKDQGAGVAEISYRFSGLQAQDPKAVFAEPVNIPGQGLVSLEYESKDKVNNLAATQKAEFFVDNVPPELFLHFSNGELGKENGLPIYPKGTLVFFAATDLDVGMDKILAQVDGTGNKVVASAMTLDKLGNHKVVVEATDRLGNVTVQTAEFVVQ